MNTRAVNPNASGTMLLDKSTAKPGNVDLGIFEKKSGSGSKGQLGQGAVNPNYLKECREDNPEPAGPAGTGSGGGASGATVPKVDLSECKITTPPDQLATDKPFEMSCKVKKTGDPKNFTVFFRLFCSITQPDGTESTPQFMNVQCEGTANKTDVEQVVVAKGTLASPVPPVPRGTKLKYHVEASHWDSATKLESQKVEVINALLPKPVANWKLVPGSFEFDSSRIHPDTKMQMGQLKTMYDANPETRLAVFGHADPVGDDEYNKTLSARRAKAMYALLTRNVDMWIALSKKAGGDDWGVPAHQWMLLTVKDPSGKVYYSGTVDGKQNKAFTEATKAFQKDNDLYKDGVIGPKTKGKLYPKYMDAVCVDESGTPFSVPPDRFMGEASENAKVDGKGTGAYQGCSELNPDFVIPEPHTKEDEATNFLNRRTVVAFFKKDDFSDSDPAKPQWPCPMWSKPCKDCKSEQFPDGDDRRKAGASLKSFPDTVSCMFYAGIVERNAEMTTDRPDIELKSQDGSKPGPNAALSGKSAIWKAVPKNGMTGTFKWSSTSQILDLEGQDTDTLTMKTREGKTSAAGTPEEIKLEFTPDGATSPQAFTFPLSVFKVELDTTRIPYGFDDGSSVIPPALPSPLPTPLPQRGPIPTPHTRTDPTPPFHLSIKKGATSNIGILVEGGAVKIEEFEFVCADASVAQVEASIPAGTPAPHSISATGKADSKTALLTVRHTPSGIDCLAFNLCSYKEIKKSAVVLLIEDPASANSRLSCRTLTPATTSEKLAATYKQAIVSVDVEMPKPSVSIPGQPESHVIALPIWSAHRDSMVYVYGDASMGGFKAVNDHATKTYAGRQCVAIVKRMTTFVKLVEAVTIPAAPAKVDSVVVGAAGRFFAKNRTVIIGSMTGAATDDDVRKIDSIAKITGTNNYRIKFTTPLSKAHPIGHGVTYGAAGWSGNPIVVVEDSSSGATTAAQKEKLVIETTAHELGHSLAGFSDVEDKTSVMHYQVGVDAANLRHSEMIVRYENDDYKKKEKQWDFHKLAR